MRNGVPMESEIQRLADEPVNLNLLRRWNYGEDFPVLSQACMLNLYGLYALGQENPFDDLVRSEQRQYIKQAFRLLTLRQKTVLILRFGLIDGVEYTLSEVGELIGVSKERVRQIQLKAIRRLYNFSKLRSEKFVVFGKMKMIH